MVVLAQQLVVVEQRARYGVLDCSHAYGQRILAQRSKERLKRGTADELNILVFEELMGGDIMEAALDALYCYSFHIF